MFSPLKTCKKLFFCDLKSSISAISTVSDPHFQDQSSYDAETGNECNAIVAVAVDPMFLLLFLLFH
jgi:hypothetical protein